MINSGYLPATFLPPFLILYVPDASAPRIKRAIWHGFSNSSPISFFSGSFQPEFDHFERGRIISRIYRE